MPAKIFSRLTVEGLRYLASISEMVTQFLSFEMVTQLSLLPTTKIPGGTRRAASNVKVINWSGAREKK